MLILFCKRKILLFALTSLSSLALHAQVEQEAQTPTRNEASESEKASHWISSIRTNPATEETYASIILVSQSNDSDAKPIVLVIACPNHNLDLYIDWNTALGRQSNVFTSIDFNRIQSRSWRMSVGDEATFYSGVTTEFLEELLEGETLNAEIYPTGGEGLSATFVLEGMQLAFNFLLENCKI